MRRFIVILWGFVVVFTASAALAAVHDFGEYTVDVLDGWTAVPQGDTVYFVKNDNSASWSVMFGEIPGGANVERYARDVMKQLKGTNFRTKDNAYEFSFRNPNGQTTSVVITSLGGQRFMQWGISGAETAGKEISQLIDSMKPKKATVKTLNTKYFTFELPKGWDGYEIDETSVRVEKEDETASMHIEIADLDEWEPDELAEFYAKEHKAKDLKNDGGTYSFSYDEDGKINVAILKTGGGVYVLIIQTANDKAGFDALATLRGLVRRK